MEIKSELRSILGLAESKSVADWWESLPGRRRRKVCDLLGISKGKDVADYDSLDDDEKSEVEAFFVKHKGKVEDEEFGGQVVDEAIDDQEIERGILLIARNDGESYRKRDARVAVDKACKEYVSSFTDRLKDDVSEMKKDLIKKLEKIWGRKQESIEEAEWNKGRAQEAAKKLEKAVDEYNKALSAVDSALAKYAVEYHPITGAIGKEDRVVKSIREKMGKKIEFR